MGNQLVSILKKSINFYVKIKLYIFALIDQSAPQLLF